MIGEFNQMKANIIGVPINLRSTCIGEVDWFLPNGNIIMGNGNPPSHLVLQNTQYTFFFSPHIVFKYGDIFTVNLLNWVMNFMNMPFAIVATNGILPMQVLSENIQNIQIFTTFCVLQPLPLLHQTASPVIPKTHLHSWNL